jgi:hypothetical protein
MSTTPQPPIATRDTLEAIEPPTADSPIDWQLWSAYSPEPTPAPQDPADALLERINSDPFALLHFTNAFSDTPVVDLTRMPSTPPSLPPRRRHRSATPYPINAATLDDAFTVQVHGYNIPRINTVTVSFDNPVKDVTIWKIEAKEVPRSHRGRHYTILGIQYFFRTAGPAPVRYNTLWHVLDTHHREIVTNYLATRIANSSARRGIRLAPRQAQAIALGNY